VRTGGVYGDLGLFTSRDSFGEDLTALFNLLTGYTQPSGFHHLLLAPTDLRDGLVERIRREADHARAGRHARIIAKMNGLADRRLIEELYAASEAGVGIDLIVRGHLLPAPRGSGAVGEHPRHLDRRPLPRARAHLPLRERGRRGVPARVRGLDAP
jgi:polyphosphate kinase